MPSESSEKKQTTVYDIRDFKFGGFIGDFEPSLLRTKEFEISYKIHRAWSAWDKHIHNKMDEYNFLIQGRMRINGRVVVGGELFMLKKGEVADPVFETDCYLIVVKVPSVPGDKEIVK